jgi:hypothetical protein
MKLEESAINTDEWDRFSMDKSNQSKIIAKIDGARFIENHTNGNIRTRIFKKGSVIKTIVDSNVEINSWDPYDELLDITTE